MPFLISSSRIGAGLAEAKTQCVRDIRRVYRLRAELGHGAGIGLLPVREPREPNFEDAFVEGRNRRFAGALWHPSSVIGDFCRRVPAMRAPDL